MVESRHEEDPEGRTANVVGQPPKAIVRYTVVFSVTALVLFLGLLWAISAFHPVAQQDSKAIGIYWLLLVGLTFVAGALGGSLYSLRGLLMHSSQNDYDIYYNYWYLLTPLAGGISGVVVFFLLLGGALTLTVATPQGQTVQNITDLALAPYVALALLAGFASRPFMLKMKDLADSLFALSNKGTSGKR
jgi:hypothetical protein